MSDEIKTAKRSRQPRRLRPVDLPFVQLLIRLFLSRAHALNRVDPIWISDLTSRLSSTVGVAARNRGQTKQHENDASHGADF
jgi:hypothetical protein